MGIWPEYWGSLGKGLREFVGGVAVPSWCVCVCVCVCANIANNNTHA